MIKTYHRTTIIWQWHFSTHQSKLTFENLVIGTVVCLQLVFVSNNHQGPSWNLGNLHSFLNFSFKDLTDKNVSLKVFKFAMNHINLYITQPCLHTLMQACLSAKQSMHTILVTVLLYIDTDIHYVCRYEYVYIYIYIYAPFFYFLSKQHENYENWKLWKINAIPLPTTTPPHL